jgi:RHS repeat-associated protein
LREKGIEILYSIADPNWNVVALINVFGSVSERMKYDAFGKVTWLDAAFGVKNASDYSWSRTFTGQVLDGETPLMLYRNRYYSVTLGRFVNRDPVGYEGNDVNFLRYVLNQSIRSMDYNGLAWYDWIPFIGTAMTCYKAIAGTMPGMNFADYASVPALTADDCCPNPVGHREGNITKCQNAISSKVLGYIVGAAASFGGHLVGDVIGAVAGLIFPAAAAPIYVAFTVDAAANFACTVGASLRIGTAASAASSSKCACL